MLSRISSGTRAMEEKYRAAMAAAEKAKLELGQREAQVDNLQLMLKRTRQDLESEKAQTEKLGKEVVQFRQIIGVLNSQVETRAKDRQSKDYANEAQRLHIQRLEQQLQVARDREREFQAFLQDSGREQDEDSAKLEQLQKQLQMERTRSANIQRHLSTDYQAAMDGQDRMRAQLQDKDQRIEELISEVKALNDQLVTASQQQEGSHQTNEARWKEISNEIASLEKLTEDLQDSQLHAEQLEQQCDTLQQSLEEREAHVTAMAAAIEKLKQESDLKKAAHDEERRCQESVSEEANKCKESLWRELEVAKMKVMEADAAYKEVDQRRKEAETQLAESQMQMDEVLSELDAAKGALSVIQGSSLQAAVATERPAVDEEIELTRRPIAASDIVIQKLEAELESLREKCKALEVERLEGQVREKAIAKTLESNQTEVTELRSRLDEALETCNETVEVVEVQVATLEQLEEEVKARKEEEGLLRANLQEAELRFEKTKEDLLGSQREKLDAEREVEDLAGQLKRMEGEAENQATILNGLELQVLSLQKQLQKVQADLEEAANDRHSLSMQAETHAEMAVARAAEIEQCLLREQALEQAVVVLKEKLASESRAAEESQLAMKALEDDLQACQDKLSAQTAEVAELSGKAEMLAHEKEAAQAELQVSKNEIVELKRKLAEASDAAATEDHRVISSDWAVQQLAVQLEKSKQLSSEKDKEIASLLEQIMELEHSVEQREQRRERAAARLEVARAQINQHGEEVNRLKGEMEDLEKKIRQGSIREGDLEEEVKRLNDELDNAQAKIQDRERKVEELVGNRQNFDLAMDKVKRQLQEAQEELCNKSAVIEELNRQFEESTKESEAERQELERIKSARLEAGVESKIKISELEDQRESLAAEVHRLEHELEDTLAQFEWSKAEVEELRKSLERADERFGDSKRKLEGQRQETQRLMEMGKRYEEMLSAKEEFEQQTTELKQMLDLEASRKLELEEKARILELQLSRQEAELANQQAVLTQQAAELVTMNIGLEETKAFSADREAETAKMRGELQRLETDLRAKDTQLSEICKLLEEARFDLEGKGAGLARLDRKLEVTEADFAAKEAEVAELQQLVSCVKSELALAEAKVTEMQLEMEKTKDELVARHAEVVELSNSNPVSLRSQLVTGEKDPGALEKELSTARADMAAKQDEVAELLLQVQRLESELVSKCAGADEAHDCIQTLKAKLASKGADVAELHEQLEGLRFELSATNASATEVRDLLEGVQAELAAKKTELAGKQAEAITLHNQHFTAEQASKEGEMLVGVPEVACTDSATDMLSDEHGEMEADAHRLLPEAQADLGAVRDMTASDVDPLVTSAEKAELQTMVEQLKSNLAAKDAQLANLSSVLEAMRADAHFKAGELETLRAASKALELESAAKADEGQKVKAPGAEQMFGGCSPRAKLVASEAELKRPPWALQKGFLTPPATSRMPTALKQGTASQEVAAKLALQQSRIEHLAANLEKAKTELANSQAEANKLRAVVEMLGVGTGAKVGYAGGTSGTGAELAGGMSVAEVRARAEFEREVAAKNSELAEMQKSLEKAKADLAAQHSGMFELQRPAEQSRAAPESVEEQMITLEMALEGGKPGTAVEAAATGLTAVQSGQVRGRGEDSNGKSMLGKEGDGAVEKLQGELTLARENLGLMHEKLVAAEAAVRALSQEVASLKAVLSEMENGQDGRLKGQEVEDSDHEAEIRQVREELKKKEDEKSNLEQRMKNLEKTVERWKEFEQAARKEVRSTRQEIELNAKLLADARLENEKREGREQDLIKGLDKLKKEFLQAEDNQKKAAKEVENLESEAGQLKSSLEGKESEVKWLQERVLQLEVDLMKEKEDGAKERTSLEQKVRDLESEQHRLQDEKEEAALEHGDLVKQVDQLSDKLMEQKVAILNLEEEVAAGKVVAEEAVKLRFELVSEKQEIVKRQQDVSRLEETLAAATQEALMLSKALAEKQKEVANLEVRLQELEEREKDFKSKMQEMKDQVEEAERNEMAARGRLDRIWLEMDGFKAQLKVKDGELGKAKHQVENAVPQLNAAKAEIRLKEEEGAKLRAQLALTESELQEMREEVQRKNADMLALTEKLEKLNKDVETAKEAKSSSTTSLEELKAVMEDVVEGRARAEEAARVKEQEARAAAEKLESVSKEMEGLKTELNVKSEETEKLCQQFAVVTEELKDLREYAESKEEQWVGMEQQVERLAAELDRTKREAQVKSEEVEKIRTEVQRLSSDLHLAEKLLKTKDEEVEKLEKIIEEMDTPRKASPEKVAIGGKEVDMDIAKMLEMYAAQSGAKEEGIEQAIQVLQSDLQKNRNKLQRAKEAQKNLHNEILDKEKEATSLREQLAQQGIFLTGNIGEVVREAGQKEEAGKNVIEGTLSASEPVGSSRGKELESAVMEGQLKLEEGGTEVGVHYSLLDRQRMELDEERRKVAEMEEEVQALKQQVQKSAEQHKIAEDRIAALAVEVKFSKVANEMEETKAQQVAQLQGALELKKEAAVEMKNQLAVIQVGLSTAEASLHTMEEVQPSDEVEAAMEKGEDPQQEVHLIQVGGEQMAASHNEKEHGVPAETTPELGVDAIELLKTEVSALKTKQSQMAEADRRLRVQLMLAERQAAERQVEAQRVGKELEQAMVKVAVQSGQMRELRDRVEQLEGGVQLAEQALAEWQKEAEIAAEETVRLKRQLHVLTERVRKEAPEEGAVEDGEEKSPESKKREHMSAERVLDIIAEKEKEIDMYVERCDSLIRVNHSLQKKVTAQGARLEVLSSGAKRRDRSQPKSPISTSGYGSPTPLATSQGRLWSRAPMLQISPVKMPSFDDGEGTPRQLHGAQNGHISPLKGVDHDVIRKDALLKQSGDDKVADRGRLPGQGFFQISDDEIWERLQEERLKQAEGPAVVNCHEEKSVEAEGLKGRSTLKKVRQALSPIQSPHSPQAQQLFTKRRRFARELLSPRNEKICVLNGPSPKGQGTLHPIAVHSRGQPPGMQLDHGVRGDEASDMAGVQVAAESLQAEGMSADAFSEMQAATSSGKVGVAEGAGMETQRLGGTPGLGWLQLWGGRGQGTPARAPGTETPVSPKRLGFFGPSFVR